MADKGEAKSYKAQNFNTTEGGLYLGHVVDKLSGAKFAAALRRTLPSPNNFKTDHYIGLQMNGELDGGIIMGAPSVLQMRCGEKPVQEVAGLWYAENGDIHISAPKGKVIINAKTIALISKGGTPSGNIHLQATNDINMKSNDIKAVVADTCAFEAEREFNITNSGRTDMTTGDFSVTEGADVALPVLLRGGQGTMGAVKFLKGVMKLIKSIT